MGDVGQAAAFQTAPEPQWDWQKPKPAFELGTVLGNAFSGVFANWRVIGAGVSLFALVPAVLSYAGEALGVGEGAAVFFAVLFVVIYFAVMVLTDIAAWDRLNGRRTAILPTLGRAGLLSVPVLLLNAFLIGASYVGLIFLVVPGVIISIGWAVIGPAFLHERDTSLIGAFGRSWALTRGYRGWVWLTQIIMNVVIFLILGLLLGLYGLWGSVSGPISEAGALAASLELLLDFAVIFTLIALYASYTTALYAHLRSLHRDDPAETIAEVFD